MFKSEISLRVRYGETDQMGYVYYGNYAEYFEVARVEALRSLGLSYKAIEEEGILLPVFSYSVKFFKPAYYDDVLIINTEIREMPLARITFHYKTYNQSDLLLNEAETTLVFINRKTGKPMAAHEELITKLKMFFG
jgi:acyl-CoA thioester hydrolase